MWSMFSFTLWPVLLLTLVETLRGFSATSDVCSQKYPSYLLPESPQFCLNDLYVVVPRLDTDVTCMPVCCCSDCVLWPLYLSVCWFAVLRHVLAPFCACFFLKGCTTVEDLNHYMAHFETEWRALDLHQMAIQWSLAAVSVTCCCTEWSFLWLKSERNWDMRFILVITH